MDTQTVKTYLLSLQESLLDEVKSIDPEAKIIRDQWDRPEGGGGISGVITGKHMEKGGANFSHVTGGQLPPSATKLRPELAGARFEALGVSVVFHPNNPYVPTSHANVRLFSATTAEGKNVWWFGGGFDLTPYYGFTDDATYWHQQAKAACACLGQGYYERFKKECDEYFYLTHRQEPRGIGGIFYDDFNETSFEEAFTFMQQVGNHYRDAYFTIFRKRMNQPFGEREKNFQKYRRGRYVEFNLLYDRGTLFGLQSNGRTESILMSLPPEVTYAYNWHPAPNTPEAELYDVFLQPRDWVNE